MESLALTIAEACAAARVGRTRLYLSIKDGSLRARKHGKRTLILREDLGDWLKSLPAVQIKKTSK